MKHYDEMIVYYHTGTGNAMKTAGWVAEEAEKRGVRTEVHSIDYGYRPDLSGHEGRLLVGFVYPTHGFNSSPAMLSFIARFPRRKNTDVFLMNTRAGGKFFRLFTPGASGIALWINMLILFLKGFHVVGARPVDLPSNWISIHPGFPPQWVSDLHERSNVFICRFINRLLDGRKTFLRAVVDIPIDVFLAPIAVLYYCIGRFFLAKTFIYTQSCNDCKLCVSNCPVGAIKIRNGKPYWTHKCESCMRCIDICPVKSIQASHLLFFFYFGLYYPLNELTSLTKILLSLTGWPVFRNEAVEFLLDSYSVLLVAFLVYALVQPLLRKLPVEKVFRVTSLTSYWRRYLAMGVSVRDFRKKQA